MKKAASIFFVLFFAMIIGSTIFRTDYPHAATITTGVTFTTNQLVQYYDLNNAINNATVSAIVSGDITDGTIAAADLGANSVTSAKILDGTILTGDIGSRTILGANIVTNGISGIEFNTNITTRAGEWDFTLSRFVANSITNTAVLGASVTTGSGDAGKVVKLNSSGYVDRQIIEYPSVLVTNRATATSGAADTWTAIGSLTTTITNGAVVVTGRATAPVGNAGTIWLRVRDSGHTISATSGGVGTGPGGSTAPSLTVSMVDTVSTVAKTYVIEIADQTGGLTWIANAATGVRGTDTITNNLGMTILQYGR